MKPFVHWSPSQVDTFTLCNRKWWFNKIMGLEIPPHPSAVIGSAMHAELETYLEHGDPKVLGPIARAGLELLPKPGTVIIEHDIGPLGLTAGGLPALGRIDCLDLRSEPPEVLDHKSIGDLKWAKTSDELAKNVQMNVYARATTVELERMGVPTPERVKVSHIAYQTKGRNVAQKTSALLTQEQIEKTWKHIDATVREMRDVSSTLSPDRVTPTKSACDAFGGCHFRDRCKALQATARISTPIPTPGETPMPDPKANPLLARLGVRTKAASEAPAAPAPETPAPAAAAPVASAGKASVLSRLRTAAENPPVTSTVLPPDAPTDPEVAAVIAAEEAAEAAAVATKDAETAAKAAAKVATKTATDEASDKTRRPRNALPRMMALGYTSADVSAFDNATLHAILDGKVQKGEEIPENAPAEAVEAAPALVVAPVAATVSPEAPVLPSPAPAPAEPPPVPVPTSAPAAMVSGGGLVLYIDCRPVKGNAQPVDLTDLLAPLMRAVASDAGVDHYTMVPYGQGPARVAALVARNPWTEGVLFADSRAPATQAVLEVIRPYATVIVQGR
jgi:CRISPR/Cas system-associated exonuclease Cas4 (RecB family)